MSVDMGRLNRLHDLEKEIDQEQAKLKAIKEARADLITDLDEYRALEEATAAVKEASARLKQAILNNRELSILEVERGEVAYKLRDLREIHSHHLVAYKEDSGRDIVRDSHGHNRHIELTAKLSKEGKPVLDQPRLPLAQYIGMRQVVGEAPVPKQLELTETA